MMRNITMAKPKIMMHYVLPGATGGPNVLFKRIEEDEILKEKYNFVSLNQKRVAGGRINIGLILEMKREIQKEKPDLVHISGMQSAGFHCMIAAVLAGSRKRLITTHGFSGDAIDIKFIKKMMFDFVVEPLTLLLATHVHGISKYTVEKKMVKKYAKNKNSIVYNFPPNFNEMIKNINVREKLGISNQEIVVTTVSRIVIDKGYKELAAAIRSMKDIGNIRYLIVGDGTYEDEFKRELTEEISNGTVIMLGKRNDVMNILAESDIFLLPTLHENLGNVFLEASMVKIPSIGTKVGGVPEVIEDGVSGILVPPFDSTAIKEALLKLYSSNDLRKTMGENAYARINNIFNSETISRKFDELYTAIIEN